MRNEQDIMHKVEGEQRRVQGEGSDDDLGIKSSQPLPQQANFLLFILIALSLLNNATHTYDYNVVIGCGLYFLSSKHPFLHKMPYSYLLIILTICSDLLVITLLWDKVDLFHALIVSVIEIVLKIGLIVVQGLWWRKQGQEERQKMVGKGQSSVEVRKEVELRKAHQAQRLKYMQGKQQLKPNPMNYYVSKNVHPASLQQAFISQPYRQFDRQQFTTSAQPLPSSHMRRN